MSARPPRQLQNFFSGLQSAAKTLDCHRNSDARIHHSNVRDVDPARHWEVLKEATGRVRLPSDSIFHLQLRLEQIGDRSRHRVIIFGRRVKTLTSATPNTQRATFNSDHVNAIGYWLRPNLDDRETSALPRLLPDGTFPHWDGKHMQLGSDIPIVILRRFLIALAAVEQVKGDWPSASSPFEPEAIPTSDTFDPDDLSALIEIEEGRIQQISASRRSRCQRLLGEAREHFRRLQPDGRLHCQVCDWCTLIPTRAEIVQIHHLNPLRDCPRKGRKLTLAQAVAQLTPLCPNCHRILESRPRGGDYTLDELALLNQSHNNDR